VAGVEQTGRDRAADETRTTRDQNLHERPPWSRKSVTG
jgi:hypothetical protein